MVEDCQTLQDSSMQIACSRVTYVILQEQLRRKLIDEPLLEHQEQFSEDPVQPMTRQDATALTDLLVNSLPLGSIQVGLRQPFGYADFATSFPTGCLSPLLAPFSLCLARDDYM